MSLGSLVILALYFIDTPNKKYKHPYIKISSGDSMSYTLADVLDRVLAALQDALYYIADAIASNASTIATVIVIGGLAYLIMRYGTRIFRGVTGWIRGLF